MPRYRITGADRDTGEDVDVVVDEPTRGAVERWAETKGIVWSSIEPAEVVPAAAASGPVAEGTKPQPNETLGIALSAASVLLVAVALSSRVIHIPLVCGGGVVLAVVGIAIGDKSSKTLGVIALVIHALLLMAAETL